MPRMGAIALVLFSLARSAGAAWEYQTAHFRVISESGPEIAVAAALHLEDVRRRFAALGPPLPDEEKGPVVVLVFADRESLDPYSPPDSRDPAITRGLSLAGAERNWISVTWDAPGSVLHALAHEYAHVIRPDPGAALWFREGMAEYLAGLAPSEGGPRLGPAPVHHLLSLREQLWTPWEEFVRADRMSAAFARWNFYSQAWLAVHWLSAQSTSPGELQPGELEALLRAQGSEWLDTRLRDYAEQLWSETAQPSLAVEEKALAKAAAPEDPPQARLTEAWEVPYWKAEFHRELQHWDQAKPTLELLERQYPEIPEPSEALAAVAIAQGRYDLAEEKLRDAVRKGSRQPSTHYQFSLMLLRPVEGFHPPGGYSPQAADRVRRAVSHARRAREADPAEPRYLLGEAQALVAAGVWNAAAERLLDLGEFPGWRERSETEFEELLRRRQQDLRSISPPGGFAEVLLSGASGQARHLAGEPWWNPPTPHVPPPGPPPKPDPEPWPPPGTVLLYGYIKAVECRPEMKVVTVKTPRYIIELRETAARPAKLYHAPKKWVELPCGLSGYEVNVVYRPLPAGGEVRGELVAVVF